MKRSLLPNGYVRVWVPGRGYVLEHRLIIEQEIGRRLTPQERVHHRNGDRADNKRENLEHCASHRDHHQRHLHIPQAEALALYASGLSTSQVAARLGASPAGIRHLARRAGVLRDKSAAARLRARRSNGQFEVAT